MASLAKQHGFGSLLAYVDVEFPAYGMNPHTFVLTKRDLCGAIHDDLVVCLDPLQQFAYVDVCMALCTNSDGVIREPPIISPQFLSLCDRSFPQARLVCTRHLVQIVRTVRMSARQGEPAVRLARVYVLQEKYVAINRLLLGFRAEAALTSFERFQV